MQFENRPELNNFKSEQQGHPVHDDITFITVIFPGDNTKKVVRPVTDGDKERYPQAWNRFANQQEQVPTGWRLEDWSILTRSEVENFKALKIYTVEAMAAISDGVLSTMGHGARSIRDKAISSLASAKDESVITKLLSENESMMLEISRLNAQMAELLEISKKKPKAA